MFAYLINLDSRQDRLASAETQLSKLTIPWERVQAVDKNDCKNTGLVRPGVFSCWKSHLLVLEKFLDTGQSHCLVLEDDLVIDFPNKVESYLNSDLSDIDFLQLGFLKGTIGRRFDIVGANFFNFILRSMLFTLKSLGKSEFITKKTLLYELVDSPNKTVAANVKAGTHSYVISRKMAMEVIKLNSPQFLAADDFFIALSHMRIFKMYRTRKSLIQQSNSPSSINLL